MEHPDLTFEKLLWEGGFHRVVGLDEAGRGAWAGPVCVAAVVLPPEETVAHDLSGVRDSKQMSPAEREVWAPRIRAVALTWGLGFASAAEIDALGILPATKLAALRALEPLMVDYVLADALLLPEIEWSQTALIKGDQRSLSVAAASVLAKTSRDAHMLLLDRQYPKYGFARHKGYGTPAHRAALERWGPCPEHRLSFAGIGLKQKVPKRE
ncbi:MAG: ribonuclease HII [Anaerolineales bacterium]|nr:ribonuclease HII [Anaerolineales bacterium]MCX7609081.1 ribonuclease HII [Anaerolineales bacterium]MDW8226830.1 ribonuclease HII [Anaerolineales bacterium]